MTDIEKTLESRGIILPEVPAPAGSYLPCVRTGNLLFLSGVLPFREGKLIRTGKVGKEITLDEAREDARQIGTNALAIVKKAMGNLNHIERCVKLTGFVASEPGFYDQPSVLNVASDLLYELLGEKGQHSRVAVGVSVLPLNVPVEIDFLFEVS